MMFLAECAFSLLSMFIISETDHDRKFVTYEESCDME